MVRAVALVGALCVGGALLAGTPAAVPSGHAAAAGSSPTGSADLADAIRGVQVLVLKTTCGAACQADTVARVAAAGCDRVRLYPTLRMASARCGVDANASRNADRGGGVFAPTSAAGGGRMMDLSRLLPGVESAFPNQVVTIGSEATAGRGGAVPWGARQQAAPAAEVPWGLDRINQASLPLDNHTDTPCYASRGAGATVYVVDSGIRANHTQFGGRASGVVPPGVGLPTADDVSGHGSHVAGTVAGATTGVAPSATVVGVRCSDEAGSASVEYIVAGLEYVTAVKAADRRKRVVLNASFGMAGPAGRVWTLAATRAAAAGVIVVVAAGNTPVDACRNHPARAAGVIVVAAAARGDLLAPWSARGTGCVSVVAPGVGILSVSAVSDAGLERRTGTSMATPHAAGLAALILAEDPAGGDLTADEVLERMTRGAPTVGGFPLAWANPSCAGVARGTAAAGAA